MQSHIALVDLSTKLLASYLRATYIQNGSCTCVFGDGLSFKFMSQN